MDNPDPQAVIQELDEVDSKRTLQERVLEKLGRCDLPDVRRLTVRIENNCLILEGEVGTYYAKQVADMLVRHVPGVGAMRNEVRISGQGAP